MQFAWTEQEQQEDPDLDLCLFLRLGFGSLVIGDSESNLNHRKMKAGRKNLKKATEEQNLTLGEGQSIAQVVSLRGSNLIEVMDSRGEKSLALFPAKFQKSMWIKRGSFVVVDHTGKEKALESGSKIACIVFRVLFYEQVRALQKSPEWPEIFRETKSKEADESSQRHTSEQKENGGAIDLSDDDGLPPLEANTNRMKLFGAHLEAEMDSGSDSDWDS